MKSNYLKVVKPFQQQILKQHSHKKFTIKRYTRARLLKKKHFKTSLYDKTAHLKKYIVKVTGLTLRILLVVKWEPLSNLRLKFT